MDHFKVLALPLPTIPMTPGPEGVTLEERKKAMAGNKGVVYKRGSMPTLLKVPNRNALNCVTFAPPHPIPLPQWGRGLRRELSRTYGVRGLNGESRELLRFY
jgi:hypothetical protein